MRYFLLVLVCIQLSPSALGAHNIFLFTIDSCRADRFGAYGYGKPTTPHIDAWAKTGTVFERAYSTTAWTAPGLVSILTGLYPPLHGVNNRDHMGPPNLVTLIKVFKQRGYQVPNLNFFTFAPYYRHLGLAGVEREYFGSGAGDELLNWLKAKARSAQSSPFFVWYHTVLVHQPYRPPAAELPAPLEELEKSPAIKAVLNGAIVPVGSAHFQEKDKAVLDQLYSAELRRVDRLFSAALEILRSRHLLEDTLVVLTADHGEELLDHGFVGHASTSLQAKLYEEVVRIPLIFSWPGRVPGGQRVSKRASQVDILPTILKLFNIKPPPYVQGRDLFSKEQQARPLFLESIISGNQTTKEHEGIWVRGILEENYKYISTGELYNLAEDPLEQNNIGRREAEVAKRLRAHLTDWLTATSVQRSRVFPSGPQIFASSGRKPVIFTPENGSVLNYDTHTGVILLDWQGDREAAYLIQYNIGTGDHHVAGIFEVSGNHQLLGPLSRELWHNLKAWNPFQIRVARKSARPNWSNWTVFSF
ncbi:MAG: sulfatase [Acidobacteriota bacterium]